MRETISREHAPYCGRHDEAQSVWLARCARSLSLSRLIVTCDRIGDSGGVRGRWLRMSAWPRRDAPAAATAGACFARNGAARRDRHHPKPGTLEPRRRSKPQARRAKRRSTHAPPDTRCWPSVAGAPTVRFAFSVAATSGSRRCRTRRLRSERRSWCRGWRTHQLRS
jgi:hypothetical protein